MSFRSKPLGPTAPQQRRRRAMDYPIICHGFRFNLAASAAGQQGTQNEEAEGIRDDIAPSTDPPSTPAKQHMAEEKGNGLRSSRSPPGALALPGSEVLWAVSSSRLLAGTAVRLLTASEERGKAPQLPSSLLLMLHSQLRRREGHRGVGLSSKTRGLCEFSTAKCTK